MRRRTAIKAMALYCRRCQVCLVNLCYKLQTVFTFLMKNSFFSKSKIKWIKRPIKEKRSATQGSTLYLLRKARVTVLSPLVTLGHRIWFCVSISIRSWAILVNLTVWTYHSQTFIFILYTIYFIHKIFY